MRILMTWEISGIPPEHSQNSLPPIPLGTPLFQKWLRRGPLRDGHLTPSSTESIFDYEHIHTWESGQVSHKRVLALLGPKSPQLEMAKTLRKPVFALPGCQQISAPFVWYFGDPHYACIEGFDIARFRISSCHCLH